MYGKLVDGALIYAPQMLLYQNKVHYHPTKEMYQSHGYLPILCVPPLQDEAMEGKRYCRSWQVQAGQIVSVWQECSAVETPTPPSVQERVMLVEKEQEMLKQKLHLTMDAVDYLMMGKEEEVAV